MTGENDKREASRNIKIAAGTLAGVLTGETSALVGREIPEYKQSAEQVAADKVVNSKGSENLSPAQAQKALIDAKAEELMRREGIQAIIDGKNHKTLLGDVAAGAAVGGATAALLTRRKKQQQQIETGAAEIS